MSGSFKRQFLRKVSITLTRYRMIRKRGRILIALSGGPDSTVLLDALHTLGHELYVCHVNHGLRGQESDADERHVIEQVERYGLVLSLQRFDSQEIELARSQNLEETARTIRYDKLINAARKFECAAIATGHTRNDQAETVLHRLVRTTGLSGLCGIHPVRRDLAVPIIRPLLDCSREEILHYAQHVGLSFRTDSMNQDRQYTRTRIRETLLPLIREQFNPSVDEALARLAEAAQTDEEFWEKRVKSIQRKLGSAIPQSPAALEQFIILSKAEQNRLLRQYLSQHGIDPSWAQIDSIQNLLESKRPQGEIHLTDTCRFYKRYGCFFLDTPAKIEKESETYPLTVPGDLDIPSLRVQVKTEFLPKGKRIDRRNKWSAVFDWDKIVQPMTIRTRKDGDTIRPLGMSGTKKVKRILQEHHVSMEERDRVPIVCFGNEIAWIVGYRQSETFRIDRTTKKTLLITLKKTDN